MIEPLSILQSCGCTTNHTFVGHPSTISARIARLIQSPCADCEELLKMGEIQALARDLNFAPFLISRKELIRRVARVTRHRWECWLLFQKKCVIWRAMATLAMEQHPTIQVDMQNGISQIEAMFSEQTLEFWTHYWSRVMRSLEIAVAPEFVMTNI